jgi:hypothetical protein
MRMRAQPRDNPDLDSDPSIVEAEEEFLDQTPPPDHEGWLEARESGLRWTRKRWELRRRMKLEHDAAEALAAADDPQSVGDLQN